MYTEESTLGQITVAPTGTISVRWVDTVLRDGMAIATTERHESLQPGDDLSGRDKLVTSIASAIWTKALVKEWNDKRTQMDAHIKSMQNQGR